MDIEKIIEALRAGNPQPKSAIGKAIVALSTLQAENERMKNKLSELAHLPFNDPGIGERTRLMAENEKLRAEADGMRFNWYKSVENLHKLRAELERVKQKYDEAREAICTHCMDVPCRCESCYWWHGQKED